MIRRGLFLILMMVNFSVAHAVDLSRWEENDLARLIQKTNSLQNYDSNKLAVLRQKWKEKCVTAPPFSCYLTEEDILPEGEARPNRVLLFRGEDGRYELGGVSTLLRNSLDGNTLCGRSCNSQSLATNMYNILNTLPITSPEDIYQTKHYYDEARARWSGGTSGGNGNYSTMEVITSKHVKSEVLYLVNKNGKKAALDPFISLSLSPGIAIGFMDKAQTAGRLFVLSVPKNKVVQFNHGGNSCRTNFYDTSMIIRTQSCGPINKYELELELNAFMHIPSEYVFDVISGI